MVNTYKLLTPDIPLYGEGTNFRVLNSIPLVYVLSPYSDKSERVRRNRYRAAEFYTGRLMKRFPHAVFYSPIVYCHPILVDFGLPADLAYWHEHNYCMICKSDLGVVLMEPGWEESEGVTWERERYAELGTPLKRDTIDSEHEIVGQALQKLA